MHGVPRGLHMVSHELIKFTHGLYKVSYGLHMFSTQIRSHIDAQGPAFDIPHGCTKISRVTHGLHLALQVDAHSMLHTS